MKSFLSALTDLAGDFLYYVLLICAPVMTVVSVYALWQWPLYWLLCANFLFIGTWVFFGHLMNLGFARHKIQQEDPSADFPHGPRQLGAVLLIAGYLLDYLLNALVFSLMLVRLPWELTVSEALNKYSRTDTWRGKIARYFGGVWINWLDLKSLAEGKQHIEMGK